MCNKRALNGEPNTCTYCKETLPQSHFRLTTSGKNKGKATRSWFRSCENKSNCIRYARKNRETKDLATKTSSEELPCLNKCL